MIYFSFMLIYLYFFIVLRIDLQARSWFLKKKIYVLKFKFFEIRLAEKRHERNYQLKSKRIFWLFLQLDIDIIIVNQQYIQSVLAYFRYVFHDCFTTAAV